MPTEQSRVGPSSEPGNSFIGLTEVAAGGSFALA